MLKKMVLNINNVDRMITFDPEDTLANTLRKLGLTGTKVGCEAGQCGICSVILNGKVIRSCVKKMDKVPENSLVTTIEGVGTPGHLHPLQLSWMVHGGAQCGICTPGFIVSAKGLLDTNPDPTREEVRDWFQKHRNACRCTGYKPQVDSVMDAARVLRGEISMDDLAFKLPEGQTLYNTKSPKPTALAKVTGLCDYGADINMKLPDGVLHLGLAHARISHANLLSVDTSEAEKMPGVYRVLTARDIEGTNRVNGLTFSPTNKSDGLERALLADTKICQYGDVLAIVAADTEAHARAAADAVKAEYEPLYAYMNGLEAVAEDAVEIHPGTPNLYCEMPCIKGGETGGIMEKAAHVVEGGFYVQRQPHLVLEPDVGLAYPDADGGFVVQCKHQFLQAVPLMVADAVGIEPDRIRMILNPAGGSFGSKMSPITEALLLAAVKATGKPVCLHMDYAQQSFFSGKRSTGFFNCRLAADEKGYLQAMEYDFLFDHGAYHDGTSDPLIEKGFRWCGAGLYIPNIRGVGRICASNHAWGTAFRAFGSPQSYMASESLADMLAEKIGMDPLEFRYINTYRPGTTMTSGCEMDVHPFPTLIDMMRPKYKAALERARKEDTPEKRRGVGISLGMYDCSFAAHDTAEIDVELNSDGSITHYSGWHDMGQGADAGAMALAHKAFEPLGLKPENIRLVMNDTAITPFTGAAAGSRSHYMAGKATIDGANKLMDAMRKPDGTYRTYQEMVDENIPVKYRGNASTVGYSEACDYNTMQGDPNPTHTYGVFMSEVEVDAATGKTKVLKMTLTADFGVIGNKLAVDGQVYGGLAQGVGLALSEDFVDPSRDVTLKAQGFPYIKDVPDDIEVEYLETPRPSGPFGSAGCAELSLTSPHVSIVNAIYNATGVRIFELPATPDKVLDGIKALERGEKLPVHEWYYLGSEMNEKLEELRSNPVVGPAH
ncbi:molybdopterin-dependent aldehyde oxidoreductase [Desulfovibrio sp. Fe33]|uniref:molybdopterin-dependent aldehyde oxidoreductase n=1 Tax=Desulfovibrio sp. Fe33 TaxID=3020842 RepID=UPI00234E0C14|nr:molybdopterin-dependent aldehyde oxidoreductase [Desulfovibrio sp. Fe33]